MSIIAEGNYWIIIIICFLFTVAITPLVKKVAFHVGAVDNPDGKRKIHDHVMPRMGGVAIFASFLLGYMIFSRPSIEMISIIIGGCIIIVTGILDDIKPIKARYKLIGQVLAAAVVCIYGGIYMDGFTGFGLEIKFGFLSIPLTIFFIVAVINAINLVDGLDGLATGISAIYFATIGIIANILNLMGGLDVILAFIMLGSCLGFLVHNFHPAKIFLGDSGSLFLGFIIATIALLGFKNVTLTSLIIPLLILAIPLLDTLFAIIRRLINKTSISEADRNHLHHQLLNTKLGHRNTVLVIYAVNLLFAAASIVYVLKDNKLGMIIYVILLVLIIWVVSSTNIISDRKSRKNKNNK